MTLVAEVLNAAADVRRGEFLSPPVPQANTEGQLGGIGAR